MGLTTQTNYSTSPDFWAEDCQLDSSVRIPDNPELARKLESGSRFLFLLIFCCTKKQ